MLGRRTRPKSTKPWAAKARSSFSQLKPQMVAHYCNTGLRQGP
jgi:hypothetical protein